MNNFSRIVFGTLITLSMCAACTPSEQKAAKNATDVSGTVCQVIVQAADPALAPLCTTAVAVAHAIEAIIAAKAQTATAAAVNQPTNAEIYEYLADHGTPFAVR